MNFLRSKNRSGGTKFILLVAAGALLLSLVVGFAPKAQAVEPIVMAAPVSLGTAAKHGYMAAQLAVEEVNKAGGVLLSGVRRPLKIVTTDIRDLETGIPLHDVVLAYQHLISRKKPHVFVTGPTRSEATLAMMENLAEAKIVHIITASVSPSIQKTISQDYNKYKYFFKISPNAVDLGMVFASGINFLKDNFGLSKIFFLTEDVLSMRGLEGFMTAYCTKQGWKVVGNAHTPLGTTDYSPSLIKARDSGAEVIFY
ncbi:ABC transporter substrate-binding protein, partial [Thermodesulfobacteriota bacterium]